MAVSRPSQLNITGDDKVRDLRVASPQIEMIGTVTVSGTTSATSVASAAYATPNVGDLILVFAGHRAGTSTADISISSAGLTFTEIGRTGTDFSTIGAWYAWSPDTTARSVTASYSGVLSTTGLGAHIYVLRGVHPTSPIDTAATTAAESATNPYVLPGVTTSYAKAWAFYGALTADDNSPLAVPVDDVAQNLVQRAGWNLGGNGSLFSAYREVPEPGPSGAINVYQPTMGPDGGKSIVFALRPALVPVTPASPATTPVEPLMLIGID